MKNMFNYLLMCAGIVFAGTFTVMIASGILGNEQIGNMMGWPVVGSMLAMAVFGTLRDMLEMHNENYD